MAETIYTKRAAGSLRFDVSGVDYADASHAHVDYLPKAAVFHGTVTSGTDGLFTLDISAAGFTTLNGFSATAVKAGTTAEDAPIVSMQSVSATSLSGITLQGASVSGLQTVQQAMIVSPSVEVKITVFGE